MTVTLEGRVAIVTGAGRGLGLAYAADLVKHGTRVVVNDSGVDLNGRHSDPSVAAAAARAISTTGESAIPSFHDVSRSEESLELVKLAMDTWGRLDIVVCNAGILRDAAFHNISEADWDDVFSTHVKGAYNVLHAAWPVFRGQRYGRVVLATSVSGFVGNFGQANYGAAKGALIGLMNVLKIEGERYNILVNCIGPGALTRMTEALMRGEIADRMSPVHVAPAVTYMCSEDCNDTGMIIEAFGREFGRAAIVRNARVSTDGAPTADWISENWAKITDLSDAEPYFTTTQTYTQRANMVS